MTGPASRGGGFRPEALVPCPSQEGVSPLAKPAFTVQALGRWAPLAIAAPLIAHRVLEQALGEAQSSWQFAAAHTLPPAAMVVLSLALWRVIAPLPEREVQPLRGGGLAIASGLLLGSFAALINLLSMLAAQGGRAATGSLDPGTAALVLHVALLAPLAEELAFRGLLYRGLRQLTRPAPAAVVSALIFAVMHAHLAQGAWALALGLFLAFAYEQTRSLLAPILIHALFNAVPVAMAVVRSRPDDFSPIWLLLSVTGVVFAFAARSAVGSVQQQEA